MRSIYCEGCKKIGEELHCPYCVEYQTRLREVPMNEMSVNFPIRCLDCIKEENNEKPFNSRL